MTHPDEVTYRRSTTGRTFLRVLLWFIVVVAIVFLIGGALYVGVPWVYRTLVVPVQQNTAALGGLEQRQNLMDRRLDEHIEALYGRSADLEAEIARFEEGSAVYGRDIETSRLQIATLEPELAAVRATMERQDGDLASLQEDLEAALDLLAAQAVVVEEQDALLATVTARLDTDMDAMAGELTGLTDAQPDLLGRLALVQTAQDLLRVRILLAEDNPGAARESLDLARQHFRQAAALSPQIVTNAAGFEERMQTLDGLIEGRAFSAGPALEALWADMAALVLPPVEGVTTLGEPAGTATVTGTVTPTPPGTVMTTGTPTPTPVPTRTGTPTPMRTPTMTPTPTPTLSP